MVRRYLYNETATWFLTLLLTEQYDVLRSDQTKSRNNEFGC